jgi:hypothetical protein
MTKPTLLILGAAALVFNSPVHSHAAGVTELIVEALIDGQSEFHVRPETVWWEAGKVAKPGMWSGQDVPTYINGAEWKPRWKGKETNGPDKSAPYSIGLKTTDLEFELLSVTAQRGATGIDKRTPPTAKVEGGHFVVRIPDPEPGGRWYKFAIRKKAK